MFLLKGRIVGEHYVELIFLFFISLVFSIFHDFLVFSSVTDNLYLFKNVTKDLV